MAAMNAQEGMRRFELVCFWLVALLFLAAFLALVLSAIGGFTTGWFGAAGVAAGWGLLRLGSRPALRIGTRVLMLALMPLAFLVCLTAGNVLYGRDADAAAVSLWLCGGYLALLLAGCAVWWVVTGFIVRSDAVPPTAPPPTKP